MDYSGDTIIEAVPGQAVPELAPTSPVHGLASAAAIIALGNVASRVLGLARETVIAHLFGATGLVSAFRIADIFPRMTYDLLVGGMVSSALVPVFSEYAGHDRDELWRVAGLMLSLTTVVLTAVVLVIELLAPQVAWLLSAGFDAELLAATARLLRITTPAIIFLSLAGITTGLLYALKRFTFPAFTAAIFNASVVVTTLILTGVYSWSIESAALGLLLGAFLQVALQLPGLSDARLVFSFNLRHPGLRRIILLYLPVVLGLVVSYIAIALDRNLASRTGEQSIAWMQYATTLIQFPLGLVSAAISLAILPILSRYATLGSNSSPLDAPFSPDVFKETLALGLKLVLLLIIPATAGLFVLGQHIVALLFQHGDFTSLDTAQTTLALRLYLIGLTFAAIDQPLVFAFYARQDTLTPATVGVIGVGIYLAAALSPTILRPLHMTDLVLANSIQLTVHALIMLWLLRRRLGTLSGLGLAAVTVKAMAASLAMGLIIQITMTGLSTLVVGEGTLREMAIVVGSGGAGLITYGAAITVLRVEEVRPIVEIVRRKLLPPY
jgi:putative peptidoglycan lipid II flippase